MQLWVLATGTSVTQTLIFGRTECHAPAQGGARTLERNRRGSDPPRRAPTAGQTLAEIIPVVAILALIIYPRACPAYPPQSDYVFPITPVPPYPTPGRSIVWQM